MLCTGLPIPTLPPASTVRVFSELVAPIITPALFEDAEDLEAFKEREKGFEAKYQHDQEMLFKITARKNKLLGLWAAEQMGLNEEAAKAYASEVVVADFEEPGDADVVRKVMGDLSNKGFDISEQSLRKKMDVLGDAARQQIENEKI